VGRDGLGVRKESKELFAERRGVASGIMLIFQPVMERRGRAR
jgi:hypothetical protein